MKRKICIPGLVGFSALLLLGTSSHATQGPQLSPQIIQVLVKNMPRQGSPVYVPGYLPDRFHLDLFEFELGHPFDIKRVNEMTYHLHYSYRSYNPTKRHTTVYSLEWHVFPISNIAQTMANLTCMNAKQNSYTVYSRVVGPVKICVFKTNDVPFWSVFGSAKGFSLSAAVSSPTEVTRIVENIIELKELKQP